MPPVMQNEGYYYTTKQVKEMFTADQLKSQDFPKPVGNRFFASEIGWFTKHIKRLAEDKGYAERWAWWNERFQAKRHRD
jgi:hypothetical protein